jgi:prepilin-type N-terminal cleavage/methylation domain-containing protein
MDQKTERGFTLVEIVVSLLVLAVGLLAMTSTSALVTRMAGDAFRRTVVAELAASRIEVIRSRARCIGETGRDSTQYADLTWELVPMGDLATVRVIATSRRAARGARVDTIETILSCR